MPNVLIVSDSPNVQAEVHSVLPDSDYEVTLLSSGAQVLPYLKKHTADLVVMDLQMGNMGGVATCLDLRLEASADRLPSVPVLLLLDRRADVFMAKRAGAQGWLVKPLDPIRLRKATRALLAGDVYFDESFKPTTSVSPH